METETAKDGKIEDPCRSCDTVPQEFTIKYTEENTATWTKVTVE
jgi:hypothetical protein